MQIDPQFPQLYSYQALKFDSLDDYIHNPSPRYWLLWPGVLMMLCYSFADLAANMIPTLISTSPVIAIVYSPDIKLSGLSRSSMGSFNVKSLFKPRGEDYEDEDLTPVAHRVPFAWWSTGLIASVILTCALLATQFKMNVGESILAMVLGFIFSFIAVLSSGTTDINPGLALSK